MLLVWASLVSQTVKQDLGSFPGLGRSSGERNGYPFKYSCLENSMDRGAWWGMVHGVTESDRTKQLTHTHKHWYIKNVFINIDLHYNNI